jgi:hypothetical protein
MDHDFGDLLYAQRRSRPSVVFFRVRDERPGSIIQKLEAVLREAPEDLAAGCIVTVEDARLRVRRLPIA